MPTVCPLVDMISFYFFQETCVWTFLSFYWQYLKCASYIFIIIGQLFISFIFSNLYVLGDIVCHYPKTVMTFVYWYTLYKVIEVHVLLIHVHVYGRRKILYCHYIVNFKDQWLCKMCTFIMKSFLDQVFQASFGKLDLCDIHCSMPFFKIWYFL